MTRSLTLLAAVACTALFAAAQDAHAQFRGGAGLRVGVNNLTRTANNAPARVVNNTVGRVAGVRVAPGIPPRIAAPQVATPRVVARVVTPRVVVGVRRPVAPIVTPRIVTPVVRSTVVRPAVVRPVAGAVVVSSSPVVDPLGPAVQPASVIDFSGWWCSEQGDLRIYQYGSEFNAQLYMADGRLCLLEGEVHGDTLHFGWAIDEATHGTGELCLKNDGSLRGSYQTETGQPLPWNLTRKN